MKKLSVFLVLLVSAVLLFMPLTINLTAQADSGDAYNYYYDFVTAHPNRTVATEYETAAANYISTALNMVSGYDFSDIETENFEFAEDILSFYSVIDTEQRESQNVVAYKRCGAQDAKLLVIGTYYGNLVGRSVSATEVVGGEGAMDNGTGVGALLEIAKELRTAPLTFDTAFVFFGSEQLQYAGSKFFIDNTEQEIFGMINLVGVGGGDNLYAYYDEVERTHGAYLNSIIDSHGYDINPAPQNRNLINAQSVTGLPYTHKGLEASSAVFMAEGIPSVNLFGYNWGGIIASESAEHFDIAGTGNDTRENLIDLYGEGNIATRLDTVAAFAVDAVQSAEFENRFISATSDDLHRELTNDSLRKWLKWILVAALITALIIISMRSGKITANCPIEVEPAKETEQHDDIYQLGSTSSESDTETEKIENDEDDIFNEF